MFSLTWEQARHRSVSSCKHVLYIYKTLTEPVSATGNSITHSRGERSGSDQYMEDGDTEIETQIKKKSSPCRSVLLSLPTKWVWENKTTIP